MNDIYKGKLVQLGAVDPEEFSRAFASWRRDSELMRLMDMDVVRLSSQKDSQSWAEKELDEQQLSQHWFTIRTLADNKMIGDIGLYVFNWAGRDAFVGLAVGDREYWGKGYGTEAMNLVLRYGFMEVNLRRVTLTVFEYNPRAIRSYEKVGFRHEGRLRQVLNKEGKRWDMLFMGILREEWLEHNQ